MGKKDKSTGKESKVDVNTGKDETGKRKRSDDDTGVKKKKKHKKNVEDDTGGVKKEKKHKEHAGDDTGVEKEKKHKKSAEDDTGVKKGKKRKNRSKDDTGVEKEEKEAEKPGLPPGIDFLFLSLLRLFYLFIHTESIAGFGPNGRVFFPENKAAGADNQSLWYQINHQIYDNWIQRILDLDVNDPLRRAFMRRNPGGRKLYEENFEGLFRFIRNYLEHLHTTIVRINNDRKRANKGEPLIQNISREDMILNLLKLFPDFFKIIQGMYLLPQEILDLIENLRM